MVAVVPKLDTIIGGQVPLRLRASQALSLRGNHRRDCGITCDFGSFGAYLT